MTTIKHNVSFNMTTTIDMDAMKPHLFELVEKVEDLYEEEVEISEEDLASIDETVTLIKEGRYEEAVIKMIQESFLGFLQEELGTIESAGNALQSDVFTNIEMKLA